RIKARLTTNLQLDRSAVVLAGDDVRRRPIRREGHHHKTGRPATDAERAYILNLNPNTVCPIAVETGQRLAQCSRRGFRKALTLAYWAFPHFQLDLRIRTPVTLLVTTNDQREPREA